MAQRTQNANLKEYYPNVHNMLFAAAALLIAAAATTAPKQIVGTFSSFTHALPNGQLPHVPMLGNGNLGILFDSYDVKSAKVSASHPGPGRPNTLDMWINTNNMWSCSACSTMKVARGCCRVVTLGGVSITLPFNATSFTAAQHIATGTIRSNFTSAAGGIFGCATQIDPTWNDVVTQLQWWPGPQEAVTLDIVLSTWATAASPNTGGGPAPVDAQVGSSANGDTMFSYVSRSATTANGTAGLPIPIVWGSLATSVVGASNVSAMVTSSTPGKIFEAQLRFSVPAAQHNDAPIEIVTVHRETRTVADQQPPVNPSPAAVAALLRLVANASAVALIHGAAEQWWATFWSKSSISLPASLRIVEEMWFGAQYALGIASSSDPRVAAPGLYGPFATSDECNWNGDFTLDYNFEAPYFGAFSSNHAEQVESYWGPILDWAYAARALAQEQATKNHSNLHCNSKTLHYACHLAPWGMQSEDNTVYMHWNGHFAALAFINHWEYKQNVTFAEEVIYPLLEGLNEWWSCYLQRVNTSADGTSYVYTDFVAANPDAEHEGQLVPDPQIGLSLARRTLSAQLDIAQSLGMPVPRRMADLHEHLAPFNTGPAWLPQFGSFDVWTAFRNASVLSSDEFSLYPVWPSESMSNSRNLTLYSIAQRSSALYSDFAYGRPVDLFAMAVLALNDAPVPAIGPAYTAEQILEGMTDFLQLNFGGNLLAYAPGGGIENIGMSRAVNEMLVATTFNGVVGGSSSILGGPDTLIHLFPSWPRSAPASFAGLLVKGGISIDAQYDNVTRSVLFPVVLVLPRPRMSIGIRNPWPSLCSQLSVECGGIHVSANVSADAIFFTSTSGEQSTRCSIDRTGKF